MERQINESKMQSQKILARFAGFLYVVLIVTGIFGIAHVPSSLILWEDPGATINNLKINAFLFRMGIISQLICFVAFIALSVLLYSLFGGVHKTAGRLMVALVLASAAVSLVAVAQYIHVLQLVSEAGYFQKIPKNLIEAQIMFSLGKVNSYATITHLFAGIWLFPFGYLVVKSKLLPLSLGVLLIVAGGGYLYEFAAGFFLAAGESPWYLGIASNLGIFLTALWLLLAGVRDQPLRSNPL